MAELSVSGKLRSGYHDELSHLETQAIGGFEMVIRSLDRTLEAVATQDIELAQIVVNDDDQIDGRYLEVHQGLITLLATQSPVATDLRLIAALIHVIKALERMGDQCVNIAKLIPLTGHDPPVDERLMGLITEMGKQVRIQVSQARRALADRNVPLAWNLRTLDDRTDEISRSIFGVAIEIGDDVDRREWAMTMLLAARALERIADNAVDIGEQVVFVVTGLFRSDEHPSYPDLP
jgi:phosphate transport system protein